MDPQAQARLRLQAYNSSSPSLRVAAAPAPVGPLSVGVAHPGNLVLGDNQGRPTNQVFAPDPNATAGGPQNQDPSSDQPNPYEHAADFIGSTIAAPFKPFAAGIARLLPGGQNDIAANDAAIQSTNDNENFIHGLFNSGKINKDQYATLLGNLGSSYDQESKNAQDIANSADRSQVLGSALQVAAAPFLGAAEGASTLAGKIGFGALEGAGFGGLNELSNNANPTLAGTATNVGVGAATGGAIPVLGALFSKAKNLVTGNPASVGLTKDTLNFVKNSSDPEQIHALLSSIYGGTSDALQNASQEIAGSNNAKFIIKQLADLPYEGGAAAIGSAAASDAIAREKYGVSPLTGEQAPEPKPVAPTPPPEIQLNTTPGDNGTPAEGAPGIKLNAATLPDSDKAAIEAAGGTVPSEANPELAQQGLTKGEVGSTPISDLKLGPNTDPNEPPDVDQVAKYIQQIKDGKPIEPIITSKDENGNTIVEDGKHRLAALKAMGETNAPTIEAGTADAAAAPTTAAVQEATPAAQVTAASAAPDEQAVTDAKQQVIDSLTGATREYNKSATARAAEKAARSAQADAAYEAAGGGQAGVYAKLGALKGDYTTSGYGIQMSPEQIDALHNAIQTNAEMRPFEKVNAQTALMKLTTGEGPTPSDISSLRKAFGDEFGNAVQTAADEGQFKGSSLAEKVGQVAGLPKSVMASGDLSATLRQGGVLASRFPKEAGSAFQDQLKYFANENNFKEGMAKIAAAPNYQEKLDAGLAVTGTEALDKSEEQFVSNLAEKIPGAGRIVAASDRAYTGFLTQFRSSVYDSITSDAKNAGLDLTPEDLKGIAKYINTFSGRGDLGQYLEQHSQTLSTALFSPRLWKSRLDMLNPVFYAKLPPVARKYALQNVGSFAALASTILGMATLAGAHVDTNPTSADFLKIKVGNTRYDIFGGLQQNIVAASREISGETTNSQTGVTTPLGSKFGGSTRLSVISDMIQNKENPLLSAASQLLRGKDRGGNPVNPLTTLANLVVPLPLSGLYQIANDMGSTKSPGNDARAVAMEAPDILGISAQTYGSVPTKDQGKPNAQGQPTYNGPIAPNMVTDYSGHVVLDKNGKPVVVQFPNGATAAQKQNMLETKRVSAVKEAYIRGLDPTLQSQMKLTDAQLQEQVKNGTISQATMDHIKNVQKTADSVAHGNNYAVPKGVTTPEATQFFQHWNSMDAKDQKAYLDQPADQNAKDIAAKLNAQKMPGLPDFVPSNRLAQLYANYEKDINNHSTGKDAYGAIDLRNKAKALQTAATKLNYSGNVTDIFQEGGSNDLKTLLANGSVKKPDLDAAIQLDNQLYQAGLTSSLKFSKKFRTAYGYGTPTGGPASSGGSGSGGGTAKGRYAGIADAQAPGTVNQGLTSLVSSLTSNATTKALPKFSAAARANPVSTIKFNAPPNVIPSKGQTRVLATPFRTAYIRTLRNSVAN